jgi:outer membrane lipoprotein-sorting protein
MRRFRTPILSACIVLGMLLPGTARAETADEILVKTDRLTNGWDDLFMRTNMTIIDLDGSRKSYVFSIAQKGEKRMIRFESGELKGMSTLVLNRDSVYAYLPGFKKVRRVAAHNMGASFAGSDFTNDDFAFTSWPATYQAALDHEDAQNWYLRCTPKPGGLKPPFPVAIAKVDKATYQLMGYEFFDERGQKVKTFQNSDLKDWGKGALRTQVILVTDIRTGHQTRLDLSEFKVNQGLPDSDFSIRELEWGR